MSYCHLHRHDDYSFLDGLGDAVTFSRRTSELNQDSLALTNHGNLCGVLHHHKACVDNGIKPIMGIESYFVDDRAIKKAETRYHLVLLAKNEQGWRNLMAMSSESFESGFYYKPRLDWELLEKYREGIIASTSCLSGYVPSALAIGDEKRAKLYLQAMLELFGEDVYIEIQPHNLDDQRKVNIELVNLANEFGVPYVAACDTHYPYQEWADTHDVMLMIQTGQTQITREKATQLGEDYLKFTGDTYYLMSEDDVRQTFQEYHPELPLHVVNQAISNTGEIAGRVQNFEFDKSFKVPKATDGPEESEALIRQWCEESLVRIGREDDPTYRERLETELSVIKGSNILDAFVVLADMARWAKDNGIRTGPGRGSAAGSLVSYLTRITAIDPIGHGLLFERFMTVDRPELPDIDIDFQHDRRHEVKEYLARRWGSDHVCDVAAIQTYGSKSALQTVARVFDLPYHEIMEVTNSLEIDPTSASEEESGDLGLEHLYEVNAPLRNWADLNPDPWKHALRLEGGNKALGKHAAGCLITEKPVWEYMPTMRSAGGGKVTAWSDRSTFPIIGEHGFFKIDVLSSTGLTKQAHTAALVYERSGVKIDFEDLSLFPVISDPYAVDEDVMQAFREGATLGVLQFNTSGLTELLMQIQPTWFGDLAAANALYRPGALDSGMVHDYGDVKNGKVEANFLHPALGEILGETYGVLVFQESVMQICRQLGGFTATEANSVRKAIAKWRPARAFQYLSDLYEKFEKGCKDQGISPAISKRIWERIVTHARYSFNKSHSSGYSLQGYQDEWLKVRYPIEFYTSLLSTESDLVPKIAREAQAQGIAVLPPDVNTSGEGFTIDGDSIRFGLAAVKGLGLKGLQEIFEKRPFINTHDFDFRCDPRHCNRAIRNSLMDAGALDTLGARFDWTDKAKAEREKQILGIALSGGADVTLIRERSLRAAELRSHPPHEEAVVGGEIVDVHVILTKKGDMMAFTDLALGADTFHTVFFPKAYAEAKADLQIGEMILVMGKVDEKRKILVNAYCTVSALKEALIAA